MTKQQPDKRIRPDLPKDPFGDFQYRQALAEEMLPMIGRIYRDNVHLLLYGKPLVNLSVSEIMNAHRFVRETENNELSEFETYQVITSLSELELGPAEVDVGIIAAAFLFDDKGQTIEDFVRNSVEDLIGKKGSILEVAQDVVLYGFGRIGRLLTRMLIEDSGGGDNLRLRAIVVRKAVEDDLIKRANLMRTDSVHGPFKGTVRVIEDEDKLIINGNEIKIIYANSPSDIDYTKYGIDKALLIDNTGVWRDKAGLGTHLNCKGISKVLLTAPAKDGIKNIVHGINNNIMENDELLGAASCTTNAIVPTLKVLNDEFDIQSGHIESVHSYTNDQNLIDNFHKKVRRGRSAALNMVITETGAGKAVGQVLPELKGKLTANAVRVPTPNVSLAIINLRFAKDITLEELNDFLRQKAFHSDLKEQIGFTNSPEVVSTDFVGDRHAGIIDSAATIVNGNKCVLYVWYDNEFGYTAQLLGLAKEMVGLTYQRYPNFSEST
ncbi:MAG: glyceraldehyde-3-phosphate dehydrogenase [Pseudomonadota bacterium]|nr:glyceraldehyde-3-phosphate dehydrogenase [Pseudomonadota bacterium]MED5348928.1 glyceraldehyde-3-phosphate dehydrogenase [Pseudomonadota bacterium]